MHELPVVLSIVLMAIMSWFTGERAIGDFIEKNKKDIRKYLNPKKWYLPSYQTVDTILTKLWYKKIVNAFMKWANQYETKSLEHVAIDWKAIWWTVKSANSHRQEFISIVSAFMTSNKKVIWAKIINTKKENEIPAILDLIDMLWIKWVVFTADALHCQKKTTEKIVKSWNHYILWVKWNQKKLKQKIKNQTKKKSYDKIRVEEKK